MGVAYSKWLARGACSVCGYEVTIARNGVPYKTHKERRVRRAPSGGPEIYTSQVDCEGSNLPADPLPEKAVLQPVFHAPGVTV